MNVAIDALVRERYELPAQELDRLVRHVRAVVNRRLNDSVAGRLDAGQLARVEGLLDVPGAERAARCTTLDTDTFKPPSRSKGGGRLDGGRNCWHARRPLWIRLRSEQCLHASDCVDG